MRIKLDEVYFIGADERQFILFKRGQGRNIPAGYFIELENLLNFYINAKIRAFQVQTMTQTLQELKQLKYSLIKAEHIRIQEVIGCPRN
jgi:hypothetical protein